LLASVLPGAQGTTPHNPAQPKPAVPAPSKPAAPAPPEPPAPTAKLNEDGVEVAGPGPDTTVWYRTKVRKALEILDPRIARWWHANSVNGLVRSRAAAFWQSSHYSLMEVGNQPVIVVDEDYTAGQTAQAIVTEVTGGWFADSIGVFYKKYQFVQTGDVEEFRKWQLGAVKEAARLASQLAEMYVSGIATLTPGGDLVLFTTDVMQRGLKLDQLVNLLPLLGHLPIGAIIVKLGKRELKVSKDIAKKFEKITQSERLDVLRKMATAKTDSEAAALVTREVKEVTKGRQMHHAISAIVHGALEKHKNLKGKYKYRDSRFEVLAKSAVDHQGWEKWHRDLDDEVAEWVNRNKDATEVTFEAWLRWRYAKEDLVTKFPTPF
jgi:hypothetical protein